MSESKSISVTMPSVDDPSGDWTEQVGHLLNQLREFGLTYKILGMDEDGEYTKELTNFFDDSQGGGFEIQISKE